MVYTPLVKKAVLIMWDAHKEDFDKAGYPYVFHPFLLATQMEDEESACVALLHDVIEDHGDRFDFDYLRKEGFPDAVVEALKLLTHDPKVPYMDYVKAIKGNEI
nr:GTP pyrophosphokinase [Bacilli bacterium]